MSVFHFLNYDVWFLVWVFYFLFYPATGSSNLTGEIYFSKKRARKGGLWPPSSAENLSFLHPPGLSHLLEWAALSTHPPDPPLHIWTGEIFLFFFFLPGGSEVSVAIWTEFSFPPFPENRRQLISRFSPGSQLDRGTCSVGDAMSVAVYKDAS